MSKGKPLDRYGLRVRPEKEILNENAWIIQAFIIFIAKLVELRKLSKDFYKAHPHSEYPEMETKENRPYVVLLVNINDIKFAIPLRTNIRHS